ncbi:hypothetical protein [Acinetobacter sp. BSP-28]|uniref:hypothetical protein n=1 Tax=Acinetobacter sp. BSP-28 TaxID=3344661 RepID=UPI0037700A0F
MADNYEHDKPYLITATFQKQPVPSELSVSYDLHATFLGVPDGGPPVTQYVGPMAFLATEFSSPKLKFTQFTSPIGFAALTFPSPKIYNKIQHIQVSGFNAAAFGAALFKNRNQEVKVSGFYAGAFGAAKTYNLRQYVIHNGFNAAAFGTPYLIGGVKYVNPYGLYSLAFGMPKVINTKANQFVYPTGINAPSINGPLVSPRFLRTSGFIDSKFGQALIYLKTRYVQAKGQEQSKYGTQWVSHNPRHLSVQGFESFNPGYPRIFDKAQKILLANSPKIVGGVFGDIAVKNTRRYINVKGEAHTAFSDWATVYSNRSFITPPSFNSALFGNTNIWNKTPSVFPGAFNASVFGSAMVADRIRKIQARGFSLLEINRFGQAVFAKSPELNPRSFNSMAFGQPWISNFKQYIASAGALSSLRMGNDITVWFRYRNVSAQGFNSQAINSPRIEHGSREILVRGFNAALLGQPTTWYRVRTIAPGSIYRDFETNHMVGGTQHIKPQGFVASLFGSRIIPEVQAVYGQGFNASIIPETHKIELYKRWVQLKGFSTAGTADSLRYGTAQVWNRKQIIQQNYDPNDGLNPGSFGQWSAIENRNKKMGAIGFNAARFGITSIVNKARQIKPQSNSYTAFGVLMIADRIRYLRLDGIENPPMSRWIIAFNAAAVLSVKGQPHTMWGNPNVINTRRQYRWVGAFDSMEFGKPMIDFRIRTLSIESRYGIAPKYIPIHKIELHTRYIEPHGIENNAFGWNELSIHWTKVTPRWTHRDYFGEPRLRNVTPELRQRSINSMEFGQPALRLSFEYYPLDGFNANVFGKADIAYRTKRIPISGFGTMAFGQLKVTKTIAPPYSLQNIILDAVDGLPALGIEPPKHQVAIPGVKSNVIFASGFNAVRFSEPHVQSNSIRVEPGIQELTIGTPHVSLRNRTISVPTMGDLLQIRDTRPRISPHTIYAVIEAPAQAKANHESYNLHYVNSDGGTRPPGEVFGHARIELQHRKMSVFGFRNEVISVPNIFLRKHYVKPIGISSFRMGWHLLLDGSPQYAEQIESHNSQEFGRPSLHINYYGPQSISCFGLSSLAFGSHRIELFNRTVNASGFEATMMGTRRQGDTLYKPQGLYIGYPAPTIPNGFNAERFGQAWVSHRVRQVDVEGFESYTSEMDISNFKGRLKVILAKQPSVITTQEIKPVSINQPVFGLPNAWLKVHYIRPDGNSDQYRKGGGIQ